MLYDSDSKSVDSLEFPKTPEIPVEFLQRKTPKKSTVVVPKTPELPPILFCETEIWTRAKRPEVEARKGERSKSEGVGFIRRFGRSYQLTPDNRLRMKQPFKVLVDIWDVLVPRSFHETLDKYVEEQLPVYLEANLESVLCQKVMQEFIDQANKFQLPPPDKTGSREEQIQAMLKNILYRQKNRPEVETLFQEILDDIWQEGYRSKRLRPPLFEEVLPALKQWNSDPLFIKVYTLATGTMEHQKQFLQATEFGKSENTYLIKDHFNSQGSYRQLLFGRIGSMMREWEPQNLFYITSSITRAKEARKAKLTPIVILREGLGKYPKERVDDENFIAITKLNDLEFYEFSTHRRECC